MMMMLRRQLRVKAKIASMMNTLVMQEAPAETTVLFIIIIIIIIIIIFLLLLRVGAGGSRSLSFYSLGGAVGFWGQKPRQPSFLREGGGEEQHAEHPGGVKDSGTAALYFSSYSSCAREKKNENCMGL
jgi:hypothetical protein